MGRPTKRTDEVVNKLCDIFKIGGTVDEAVSQAKITKPTFYSWMEDEGFFTKIEEAKHYADVAAKNVVVGKIIKEKDDQNARWWLEKRQFKTPTKQDLTQINVGGDLNIENVVNLSQDERQQRIDEYRTKLDAIRSSGGLGSSQE